MCDTFVRPSGIVNWCSWAASQCPQRYVDNWREPAALLLVLALLISLCLEPIFYCANHSSGSFDGAGLFTDLYPETRKDREVYNLMSMVVIAVYMVLLMDLATLSRHMAAYVLVALNVLPELFLLLISIGFLILMFATCIAVSSNDVASFQTFPMAILRLFSSPSTPRVILNSWPLRSRHCCVWLLALLLRSPVWEASAFLWLSSPLRTTRFMPTWSALLVCGACRLKWTPCNTSNLRPGRLLWRDFGLMKHWSSWDLIGSVLQPRWGNDSVGDNPHVVLIWRIQISAKGCKNMYINSIWKHIYVYI